MSDKSLWYGVACALHRIYNKEHKPFHIKIKESTVVDLTDEAVATEFSDYLKQQFGLLLIELSDAEREWLVAMPDDITAEGFIVIGG